MQKKVRHIIMVDIYGNGCNFLRFPEILQNQYYYRSRNVVKLSLVMFRLGHCRTLVSHDV